MPDQIIPPELLSDVARRFKLLGEPVRLELLSQLQTRGEMHVQALVDATGHGQANISKHLSLMTREGLVRRRQEGIYAYYSIADPSLSGLCLLVCAQLQGHLIPSSANNSAS